MQHAFVETAENLDKTPTTASPTRFLVASGTGKSNALKQLKGEK